MSRDLSRYFSCETYLVAYAGGSRDGFVREHVDNCSFCEALVYGGTEEFPLSFDEEVAQVRAERERARKAEGRRRFLKIGAAVVLGLATIGTTGVIASKYLNKSPQVSRKLADREAHLDQVFLVKGAEGIRDRARMGSEVEVLRLQEWVARNQSAGVNDVLIELLSHANGKISRGALITLRRVPPSNLVAFKAQLRALRDGNSLDPSYLKILQRVIDSIPGP